MREYKQEIVQKQESKLVKITCDICKKEMPLDDFMEIQEMVCIEFVGGYGSVFGDGDRVILDMCQQCFKEKLGEYVHTFYEGD